MKILYDHQAFTFQYFGGVSKCFCELISRLPQDVKYEISIKQSANEHLKNSNLVEPVCPVKFDKQMYLKMVHFRGRSRFWNEVLMRIPWFMPAEKVNTNWSITTLRRNDWDVFHPTFFNPYFLPYLNNKPYVITVHDMISELYPKMKEQALQKAQVVRKASAIIAVSENTKKDLCELLNIPEKKVHVIYHGGPKQEMINENPLIKSKYILFAGHRKGYKLFDKTLIEFMTFHRHCPDVKLLCTGIPFEFQEIKMIRKWRLEDAVIYFRPTDQELKNLYANALAFIYPSEYEGFGMPILEAFAYGCPVLLNKKSCFPEIAKDAALYFDTSVDGSMHDVMEKIYSYTSKQRSSLVEMGYKRLSGFSWNDSAKKLVEVYKSVM